MGDFQTALGEYINIYRKQRHISIRALAPGRDTTLSRFLNRGNKVSVQLITDAMRRMGLQYADLAGDFPRFNAPFTTAAENLMAHRYAADSSAITAIADAYLGETATAKGKIAELNRLVFEHIKSVSEAQQMSLLPEATQAAIEEVLADNADWLIYDYLLLRLTVGFLSDTRVARCYLLLKRQMGQMATGYQHYANDAMLQCGIILLTRRLDEQLADFYSDSETAQAKIYNFQDALVFNAVRRMIAGRVGSAVSEETLNEVFAATTTVELPQVEGYLRRLLAAANGEVKGVFL
ncbi:hypothetical protein [Lacticaseibacillus parakribbianus]|uniref:hypothetical protein n=1 Tax=Lacticaseibacillus parakribbianus TaxID=2970927 RepID=UPI0021CAF4F9|nr:hypothetical protein [Lacticaseibacillus parakribbianus]